MDVHIGSENKMWKLGKEIVGENMIHENRTFTFPMDKGGEEIREVMFVYVPNLIDS